MKGNEKVVVIAVFKRRERGRRRRKEWKKGEKRRSGEILREGRKGDMEELMDGRDRWRESDALQGEIEEGRKVERGRKE